MTNYNAFILGLHLIVAILYLLLANLKGEYLYILYFGSESLFFGLGLIFALSCLDKTYTYLHIAFVWVRGLIYILHY
ncbi:hypothetical protein U2242_15265, partial [Listeria monocytogenes]|uniref:hypothetical protein n=1 Tax=Listeria monocytogenes TaxID=1639 RepID=UPI002FDC791B